MVLINKEQDFFLLIFMMLPSENKERKELAEQRNNLHEEI